MPRLDAERVALWRRFCVTAGALQRRIDMQLVEEQGVGLSWFDALSALRDAGGAMRVHELCDVLSELPSSLSRRLDRMEEQQLVIRRSTPTDTDRRAVTVSLTARGRQVWRDANVTFRRAVQQQFAHRLTETDVAALQRVFAKTAP